MSENDPQHSDESIEVEVEKSNPAKRLHTIISLARAQSDVHAGTVGNGSGLN